MESQAMTSLPEAPITFAIRAPNRSGNPIQSDEFHPPISS